MRLTPAELDDVETWATLLFSMDKVAMLLQVDSNEFKSAANNPETEIYKRYHRGFTLSEVDIRKRQIELAKSGSAAAIEETFRYIHEAKSTNQL